MQNKFILNPLSTFRIRKGKNGPFTSCINLTSIQLSGALAAFRNFKSPNKCKIPTIMFSMLMDDYPGMAFLQAGDPLLLFGTGGCQGYFVQFFMFGEGVMSGGLMS